MDANKHKITKNWENNLVIPIYKKGQYLDCHNYQAICLPAIGFKIYTGILKKILRKRVTNKLR